MCLSCSLIGGNTRWPSYKLASHVHLTPCTVREVVMKTKRSLRLTIEELLQESGNKDNYYIVLWGPAKEGTVTFLTHHTNVDIWTFLTSNGTLSRAVCFGRTEISGKKKQRKKKTIEVFCLKIVSPLFLLSNATAIQILQKKKKSMKSATKQWSVHHHFPIQCTSVPE